MKTFNYPKTKKPFGLRPHKVAAVKVVKDPSVIHNILDGYITGNFNAQRMYAEKNHHITFSEETYDAVFRLPN